VTALEYREYALSCDGPGCTKTYGWFGVERSRAALRKLAAKEGWTHVRSPRGRRADDDFCPDHKPTPEDSP